MSAEAKRGLVRNIISVLTTKVFVLLIGVISAVFIARGLGTDGRGIYAALLVYPNLLIALTEGGMRQAAVFYIGKKKASDAQIIGTLLSYTLFAGVCGYFLVYFLQSLVGQAQFTNTMMLIAAGILPATLAVNAIKGVFLGKERIKQFNKASWIQKALFVLIISVLYFSEHLTVQTAIAATLGAAVFNLFQAILFLRSKETLSLKFSLATFIPMFKLGLVYALAFFFITANYRVDVLLLSILSTPSEVGLYALAVQLGELLWQLPGAVLIVIMSKTANSEDASIIQTVAKTTRVTFFLTILSAIPFTLACYYLIEPVFGKDFGPSYTMILYLLPGLIFAAYFKTINAYFAGQGQPLTTVYLMGTVASINVALNILLIPKFGGIGAGISTTVSYAISAIGCCWVFAKKEKIQIRSLLFPIKNDFSFSLKSIRKKV